jgi:hypothetical protein
MKYAWVPNTNHEALVHLIDRLPIVTARNTDHGLEYRILAADAMELRLRGIVSYVVFD